MNKNERKEGKGLHCEKRKQLKKEKNKYCKTRQWKAGKQKMQGKRKKNKEILKIRKKGKEGEENERQKNEKERKNKIRGNIEKLETKK